MNNARYQSILRSQSATARKVYEACPLEQWWTPQLVIAELQRSGMTGALDLRHVTGCLSTLVEANLLRERSGTFQRAKYSPAKPAPAAGVKPKTAEPLHMPTTKPAADDTDPLVAILSAVERLRELAKEQQLLAASIEQLAMRAVDRVAKSEEGTKKLRDLAELLRGME